MSTRTLPPGVFKPVCPECKYDLSGLADGCCPECGTAFTRDGLIALGASRKRTSYHVVTTIIAYVLALLCPISPLATVGSTRRNPDPAEPAAVLIVVAGSIATWSLAQWAAKGNTLRGLLTLSPALCLIATRIPLLGWNGAPTSVAILAATLAASVCLGEKNRSIGRFMTVAMYSTGLLLLGVSAPMALIAWSELRMGDTWSIVDDPRPGQVHQQYPLTNSEALVLFAVLLVLSLVLVAVSVAPLRQATSRTAK